jgi:hypothetical protein
MYDGDNTVKVSPREVERFKSLGLTMEKKVAAPAVKKEEETVTKKTESTVKSGTK